MNSQPSGARRSLWLRIVLCCDWVRWNSTATQSIQPCTAIKTCAQLNSAKSVDHQAGDDNSEGHHVLDTASCTDDDRLTGDVSWQKTAAVIVVAGDWKRWRVLRSASDQANVGPVQAPAMIALWRHLHHCRTVRRVGVEPLAYDETFHCTFTDVLSRVLHTWLPVSLTLIDYDHCSHVRWVNESCQHQQTCATAIYSKLLHVRQYRTLQTVITQCTLKFGPHWQLIELRYVITTTIIIIIIIQLHSALYRASNALIGNNPCS